MPLHPMVCHGHWKHGSKIAKSFVACKSVATCFRSSVISLALPYSLWNVGTRWDTLSNKDPRISHDHQPTPSAMAYGTPSICCVKRCNKKNLRICFATMPMMRRFECTAVTRYVTCRTKISPIQNIASFLPLFSPVHRFPFGRVP